MKTTEQVRKYLKKSVKYRNDDRLLRLRIWEDFGFYLTKEQKEIYWSLPADGAISRRRREMREEFPESPNIMNKRFKLFVEERDKRSKFPKKLLRRIRG